MIGKKSISVAFFFLVSLSTEANAWFFFFIPNLGSRAEGSQCVKESAKVGDVLRSPSGNTATIKSISGTSSRCSNPQHPVLATLDFSNTFTSRASIEIPEGYEQKPLTDNQKFQGGVLYASNQYRSFNIYVRTLKREIIADPSQYANAIGKGILNVVLEGKTSNEEQILINGMRAWRFEITGKSKGVFGKNITYLVTVLEGDRELVGITGAVPTDDFQNEKTSLKHVAETVSGIKVAALPGATPAIPTAIPSSQGQATPAIESPGMQPGGSTSVSPPPGISIGETPSPSTAPDNSEASATRLRELDKLYKEGVLGQQEYEAKKREILKGM